MSYNVSNPVPRQHGARSTTIVNDAYYPGPGGKMHSWKRNLALELAQTKLPKKVYDHGEIDHASEVFGLPRPYEAMHAQRTTLCATQDLSTSTNSTAPDANNHPYRSAGAIYERMALV